MRLFTILALMLAMIPIGVAVRQTTTATPTQPTFFCDYVPTWPGCRR